MKGLVVISAAAALFGAALAPVGAAMDGRMLEPTAVERLVRQEDGRRNDLQLGITRATQIVPIPPAPRIEVVARDDFDWREAALGAAAGVVALTAAIGTALVVRSTATRQRLRV
jgi:hypothetical protein